MPRKYAVSIAQSRFNTNLKLHTLDWEEVKTLCTSFKVTTETHAFFRYSRKEKQTEIKDVGGFVGGRLLMGRRGKGYVESRSLLTLDYDGYSAAQLERAREVLQGRRWCVYSTHSHRAEEWRCRLVIALSRDVSAAEYERVGRALVALLGDEGIDRTTLEPHRLMFLPSRSCDAPYIAEAYDGDDVDVDALLPSVPPAQTPEVKTGSTNAADKFYDAMPTMPMQVQDPTTKPGVIGAFCRVYDVPGVIDAYLSNVYRRGSGRDRYTYANGSTANGAVVYADGKLLWSNHSTDPAAGHCCNAWDLVRIHLCDGDNDAMTRLAEKDAAVTALMDYEAMTDFNGLELSTPGMLSAEKPQEAEEPPTETTEAAAAMERVTLTRKKGKVESTRQNIIAILSQHPQLKDRIRHNRFSSYTEVCGRMPWTRPDTTTWTDTDTAALRCLLEARYSITGESAVNDALVAVAMKNAFHPVKEYFESLHWDGVERLERLFIHTLGAPDTRLTRALTAIGFSACVARIYDPGCKYDYCITLQGPEGCGKSTVLSKMGGTWFTDSLSSFEGKDAMDQIQGKLIVEIGEMNAYKRGEITRAKQFISSTHDDYRGAYQRRTERRPRQCVFFGTTNEQYFLRSMNGDRRFPVITIDPARAAEGMRTAADVASYVEQHRDQLWAEAKHRYDSGQKLYLPADLEQEAREIQREHSVEEVDPLRGQIEAYLELELPREWNSWNLTERRMWLNASESSRAPGVWPRNYVCVMEIMMECLGYEAKTTGYRSAALDVSRILNKLPDWTTKERNKNFKHLPIYGKQMVWARIQPGNK